MKLDRQKIVSIAGAIRTFALGRLSAGVMSLGASILTVRLLSVTDFAGYTIIFSLNLLVAAITNFGFDRVLSRFVPNFLDQKRFGDCASLLGSILVVRSILTILASLLVAFFFLHDTLLIIERRNQLLILSVITLLSLNGIYFSLQHSCHALARHHVLSRGFILESASRLFLIIWLAYTNGKLDLEDVVAIEVGAIIIASLSIFHGLFDAIGTPGRFWESIVELQKISKYLSHTSYQIIIGIPVSFAAVRFISGSLLDTEDVARLGYICLLGSMALRYMPTTLFQQVIEPFIFKMKSRGAHDEIQALVYFQIKLSLIVLFPLSVWAWFFGDHLLALISNFKYSTVGELFAVSLIFVMSESARLPAQTFANATNRTSFCSGAIGFSSFTLMLLIFSVENPTPFSLLVLLSLVGFARVITILTAITQKPYINSMALNVMKCGTASFTSAGIMFLFKRSGISSEAINSFLGLLLYVTLTIALYATFRVVRRSEFGFLNGFAHKDYWDTK